MLPKWDASNPIRLNKKFHLRVNLGCANYKWKKSDSSAVPQMCFKVFAKSRVVLLGDCRDNGKSEFPIFVESALDKDPVGVSRPEFDQSFPLYHNFHPALPASKPSRAAIFAESHALLYRVSRSKKTCIDVTGRDEEKPSRSTYCGYSNEETKLVVDMAARMCFDERNPYAVPSKIPNAAYRTFGNAPRPIKYYIDFNLPPKLAFWGMMSTRNGWYWCCVVNFGLKRYKLSIGNKMKRKW